MTEPEAAAATGEVTSLLRLARDGNRAAFDRLFAAVYRELRRVAGRQMRRERDDHTLYPTALVHEAYLRLVDQAEVEWQDRAHFLGIAARAMRQILVDHARRRMALKRGGGEAVAVVTDLAAAAQMAPEELLALDGALESLGEHDERLRRVVELRFFAGATETEMAGMLGVTTRTIQRDWIKARAWLYARLYPDG
ncbi:MAG TPA: sigma-70 family RNA polymerase sigma factor [Vicinamibacterales bacterium]|nr:sigma-70 family RNA polymerase sigma factor [Vicinamibacterales bacterium]